MLYSKKDAINLKLFFQSVYQQFSNVITLLKRTKTTAIFACCWMMQNQVQIPQLDSFLLYLYMLSITEKKITQRKIFLWKRYTAKRNKIKLILMLQKDWIKLKTSFNQRKKNQLKKKTIYQKWISPNFLTKIGSTKHQPLTKSKKKLNVSKSLTNSSPLRKLVPMAISMQLASSL